MIAGEGEKDYELGKLSRDNFYYHIRLQRTDGAQRDLPVTVRVFICPENRVNEHRRWIEMDKFVKVFAYFQNIGMFKAQ